jgi:hypothetical protein
MWSIDNLRLTGGIDPAVVISYRRSSRQKCKTHLVSGKLCMFTIFLAWSFIFRKKLKYIETKNPEWTGGTTVAQIF